MVARPPTVGVIIVNWNSFEFLKRCLSALADIDGQITRTIVVDNNSDSTPIELPYPRPKNSEYIRLDRNRGFAGGNNLALSYLHDCELVALVNPDAFVDCRWLKMLLDASVRHADCSMFASCLLKAEDPKILDGVGDSYHLSGLAWRRGHGMPRLAYDLRDKEVFAPCAAAALYRREPLVALGGFDEDFFCYFEDVDLAFRLRLAGHKCMLVSNAFAYHIGSATTGGQKSDFAIYHGHRNLVWTYVKNMPGWLFWVCLPLHIAMNLVAICVFVARGKGKVILRAKWDAMRKIPKMWQKRQGIQKYRVVSLSEVWRLLDKTLIPSRRS